MYNKINNIEFPINYIETRLCPLHTHTVIELYIRLNYYRNTRNNIIALL